MVTSERKVIELSRLPSTGALYRRVFTGMLPRLGGRRSDTPPEVELTVRGIGVDREHLAEYDRVCGFRLTETLAATYPHIMGFPLALQLMTTPGFPIPVAGIVHVGNKITVHRPIQAGETLDFAVHATDLRPHPRGRQIDVVLTGSVGDEVVWRGISTYLGKQRGMTGEQRREPGERPAPPAASATWRVEPRVGTDYARVSGDHNPIHTSQIGARLLGFPHQIAHGMWSKARCLAALQGRLPDAYTVDVAFKLPVPLPTTVAFSASRAGEDSDGWVFALHNERTGKPHLAGTIR